MIKDYSRQGNTDLIPVKDQEYSTICSNQGSLEKIIEKSNESSTLTDKTSQVKIINDMQSCSNTVSYYYPKSPRYSNHDDNFFN